MSEIKESNLPENWYLPNGKKLNLLNKELQIEITRGHLLYEKDVIIVAYCDGSDDILCQHKDKNNFYSLVHLTWSCKPEINTNYPIVIMQGSFEDFLNYNN
ncbi:MAG: hypothetical protein CR967_01025 [Proteobacteria bacterium]|nr:MAG: hypothetical protein CR967_01025 [Pseudomonadota bacterium]